jgi:N-acetylglucosaminyl-diphospho-decaprenol L-rhamnosyltransferase
VVSAATKVSIVIVAYRARDHTLRCLDSIRQHVRIPHEVVVVDDGSGDGTAKAVSERFPDVRLVAKPHNEGLVAGRNSALPLVTGRHVLMLDADTEVRPGAVETLAGVLDDRAAVGLVGPRLVDPDGELQLSCRRYSPLMMPLMRRGPYAMLNPDPPAHRWHLMKDFDHSTERPVVWVSGAAQMWRSELIEQIGGFDPRISSYGGEDKDWCLRVWEHGLEVRYVPQAEIVHHWQHVIRRDRFSKAAWRALWDWYYVQWKHRGLRHDPRLSEANS